MSIYMGDTAPYFYIIQDTYNGMYYVGAKWSLDANKNKFMIDGGYITSSKIIKEIVKKDGVGRFIIRKLKIFSTAEDAYNYETRFLKRVDAKNNIKFYNGHNNDGGYKGFIYVLDEDGKLMGIKPDDYNRDRHTHTNRSKIVVKDSDGNVFRVEKDDPRWLSGELDGIMKNVRCHDNARKAASKKWKGVPNSQEQNRKISEKNKKLKWYINVKTGQIKRFQPGLELADFTMIIGPHRKMTLSEYETFKRKKEEDRLRQRNLSSRKRKENNSKAQIKFWNDNPLHGLKDEEISLIIRILNIYKDKPEISTKNSIGREISYQRSFANVYSKIFNVSHHSVYSVVNGKKNRILNGLMKNNKISSNLFDIILEILSMR
jgi:hypothetical protein